MSKFRKIPFPRIKKAAQQIAQAVRPEKIILFGSYAHGRPNYDSDVDFLIVVRVEDTISYKQQINPLIFRLIRHELFCLGINSLLKFQLRD